MDGGASTAILGTFIAGMGDAGAGQECDCEQLAASLAAGLRALAKQTRAQPGDKTMMDALVPAVEAFKAAACAGKTIARRWKAARAARREPSDQADDSPLRAREFLGEKTRGSPTPAPPRSRCCFADSAQH